MAKAQSLAAEGKADEAKRFEDLARVALKRQIDAEQEATDVEPSLAHLALVRDQAATSRPRMVIRAAYNSARPSEWFAKEAKVPAVVLPFTVGAPEAADLTALFEKTFYEPMTRNGLDLAMLRQGSFFTAVGKQKVPGAGDSYGTARELMRYLLRMEQGRLVDEFSSREIKRLIYVTETASAMRRRQRSPTRRSTSSRAPSTSARRNPASPASPTPATSRTS